MKNQMFIQPALQNISELPIISQVNNERHQYKGNHGVQTSLVLILDVVLCSGICAQTWTNGHRTCWEF